MNIIQAILLGLVQGITEFLPISSSGHLVLVPYIFGWKEQSVTFDIILHAGTVLAIIFFYRKKLITIAKNLFSKDKDSSKTTWKLVINLILTTIPAVIFALLAKDLIEGLFREAWSVAVAMITVGILLIYINYIHTKNESYEKLNKKGAIIVGISQAMALIRGVSRSGASIIGGILTGLSKQDAIEYSFLAAIPVILATVASQVPDLLHNNLPETLPVLLVGFVTSFLSGLLAINFLMSYIKTHDFKIFGIYRIVLGIIILLIVFSR